MRTDNLTKREIEVLHALSKGAPPKIAARQIGISYWTLRCYVRDARFKLDARNATHAVAIAMREGVIK